MCMRQALPIQRPAQAQLSPARPAEVPGATNSVVRLPSSQQPNYGFAASWLRLASGPAQPATRLSKPHPSPPCLRLARLTLSSAWAHLASSPAQSACWPGLSDVSETGLRPSPAIAQPPQCGCVEVCIPTMYLTEQEMHVMASRQPREMEVPKHPKLVLVVQ